MELADTFCSAARRRVEAHFAAIASNDDVSNYDTATGVLAGRYEWLEQGVVPAPTEAAAAEPERTAAAAH